MSVKGGIEKKSVPRITVWHYEACIVIPNSELGCVWGGKQVFLTPTIDSFSCSPLNFALFFLKKRAPRNS